MLKVLPSLKPEFPQYTIGMDWIRMKLLSLHILHWGQPIMKTEIRNFVAAVATLSLLASCAQTDFLKGQSGNTSATSQNTGVLGDHDIIARRYENTAKELLVKAAEREQMLQHYEDKSYLYGRRGQDFQAQAIALARKYNLDAKKASAHAAFHRRMSELAKRDNATAGEPLRQVSSR